MSGDPFVTHRSLLFTVAYEMLGSAADAEDVVQETWLRWAGIGDAARNDVRDPRAYLVRVVTRQALNRLRSVSRRREDYVGEWLPEPLLTSPDIADDVELADSVSIAMLTVLETLARCSCCARCSRCRMTRSPTPSTSPPQRSDRSRTARAHVAARRPRMTVSRTEQQQVVERFLLALTTGDLQALMDVLAPDVVLVADGGGLAPAARHPVEGSERVAAFLSRFSQFAPGAEIATLLLNGAVAAGIDPAGELSTAVTFVFEGGRIARIYAIRNPHKLGRLEQVAELRR